jgi:8-oxo-dGTP diphosphatase
MAAGALIRDEAGAILIVQPTYRPEWLVPGGSIEADESPHAACIREVQEELGLTLPIGRLLCAEYRSAAPEKSESVQWIFDGGTLNAATLAQITLPPDELASWRCVPIGIAETLLEQRLMRRMALALEAQRSGACIYAENGIVVGR